MADVDVIKTLYRKYRPSVWSEVKYQDHVVSTLKNAIAANKVGHAYIFSGPRGTGKTTAARLLAKAVNCTEGKLTERPCGKCANCEAIAKGHFIDLIEIDAASHTGVDDARDLIEKVMYTPNIGLKKVYIIDEVHMLSKAAFNALLKTIEEPPAHVIFILATTELDKVMPTILSRCQRFEFRRFPLEQISQHLAELCKAEGIDADEDALLSIARNSAGGMRDAISLLDQLGGTGEKLTLALVQRILGTAANEAVIQTVDAIIAHDAAKAIELAHEVLDRGASSQSFIKQLIEHLRNIMLVKTNNLALLEVTENVRETLLAQSGRMNLLQVIETIKELNVAGTDRSAGILPGLALETSLAKLASAAVQASPVLQVAPTTQAVIQQTSTTFAAPTPTPRPTVTPQPQAAVQQKPPMPQQPASVIPPATPKQEATNPTQPSAASPSQDAAGAKLTMEQLKAAWATVRDQIAARDKNYLALYRESQVMDFADNTLLIGFKSDILAKKFDEHKERGFVTEQFRQALGAQINVRAGVANINTNIPSHVKPDGMVAAAIELGGKLVK